jgi:hypothetical protein
LSLAKKCEGADPVRILVIPDVHLKPFMFDQAAGLLKKGEADRAVCLMDIADDWGQQYNIDLYVQTYDAAIRFAKGFPDTLWCYGNHDLSYPWQCKESGYSPIAPGTVCEKLEELKNVLPEEGQMAYLQRIDHVLFSHGGLADAFVRKYVPAKHYNDVDAVLETINGFERWIMWQDLSPLWLRPQYTHERMYKPRKLLQVVGHTPVRSIERTGNLISSDTFSTYRNGERFGPWEYTLVDTKTWEHKGIRNSV